MTTAQEVIQDALAEILVQGSEAPLEASEYQSAIRMMNDFMFDLDINGTSLGYTEVSNLGDTVTLSAGLIMALKKNLAVLLAPQFGAQVDPNLQVQAAKGVKTMKKAGAFVPDRYHPSTLPIGAGNQFANGSGAYINPFFPNRQTEILRENNQVIAVEDDTSGQSN